MQKKKSKSKKKGGGTGGPRLPKPEKQETPEMLAAVALERSLQQQLDLMDGTRRGSLGKVQELIHAGADLEGHDSRGETAFHVACYKGHLECVQALKAGGCSIDVLDASGCTGLMVASNSGRLEVLTYLLEQGSDIDTVSLHGHSAFMLAYLNGHADCVRLLVRKGCDTASKTKNLTGLMEASMGGRVQVVWAMLDGGVPKDAMDKDGRTAFHWACAKNHPDCAEALSQAGCDTTIENKQGHTGIHMAQRLGHAEVVNRMRELVACKLADANELAGKTIMGDDIDWSQRGYTAFHLACAAGHVEHVEAMFRAGIDTTSVTTTNDNFAGETGYDVAKRLGYNTVVKRLEELQAEVAKQAKKDRDNRRKKEQKKRKKLLEQQQKQLAEGKDPTVETATETAAAVAAAVEGAGSGTHIDIDDPIPEAELEPEPEPRSTGPSIEEITSEDEVEGLRPLTPRTLDIEEAPQPGGKSAGKAEEKQFLAGLTKTQVEQIISPLNGAAFLGPNLASAASHTVVHGAKDPAQHVAGATGSKSGSKSGSRSPRAGELKPHRIGTVASPRAGDRAGNEYSIKHDELCI